MSKNESGVIPLEYHVLVKPSEVLSKTSGGVHLPSSSVEQQTHATNEAEIVAIGGLAFTQPTWPDAPSVGDKVLMKKYAGTLVTGKDGSKYRIINDKDVGAILT